MLETGSERTGCDLGRAGRKWGLAPWGGPRGRTKELGIWLERGFGLEAELGFKTEVCDWVSQAGPRLSGRAEAGGGARAWGRGRGLWCPPTHGAGP